MSSWAGSSRYSGSISSCSTENSAPYGYTYNAQSDFKCYFCHECPIEGPHYVYTKNSAYFSCRSCGKNKSDWRRVRRDERINWHAGYYRNRLTPCECKECVKYCHNCEKSIHGTRYVDRESKTYSLCSDCLPSYHRNDWHRVRSQGEQYRAFEHQPTFDDDSDHPKCEWCKKTPINGTHYVDRNSGLYSLCKSCIPYYHRSDWRRVGKHGKSPRFEYYSPNHDNEDHSKCEWCSESPIRGKRYVDRKSGLYSLCKSCMPNYERKDWRRVRRLHS